MRKTRTVGRPRAWGGLLGLLRPLLLAACGPGAAPTDTPVGGIPTATPTPAAPAGTLTPGAATATPGAVLTGTPTITGTLTPGAAGPTPGRLYTIGILQTVSQPALDFAREGVKQAFLNAGFVEGTSVKFDVQNAQNDGPTAQKLAAGFLGEKADAIVTLGTLATAQAVAAAGSNTSTPIIFAAVADPYGAKLAGRPDGSPDPSLHPANLTGVQALPPVEGGLRLIKDVLPNAKTIGLLWNPGEPNSLASTLEVRRLAPVVGFTVLEAPVASGAAAGPAAAGFADKNIDAFFVSTTNSVAVGLDAVVLEARRTQKPLFGNDPQSAARGAVAALGLDYAENGRAAGDLAVRIVTGKALIAKTDIAGTTRQQLCVNTLAAAQQGVTLPAAVLTRATGCVYTAITSPVPPTAGP